MKKNPLVLVLLALVMVFSLCACGEKAPAALEVHNFAELEAAIAGEEQNIKLVDFDTTGETTHFLKLERPLTLDGNDASIDFGFEVLSGGVTIKNMSIATHTWDQAVSKNGKNGTQTGGDCICIEIHNAGATEPVTVENVTIEHDVFDNNNSAIYVADGSYVEILNNNITVLNEQNNSRERGGVFVGAGTSGKIMGNTIDSARTAFPMSPMGLTVNLDKMEAVVEMPEITIKDNTASAIYVTKMYTNGDLFGVDGLIKADDSDFGVREALEKFLVALDENNEITNKPGTLAADENVFVVSRLDLIYSGVSLKDASVYFEVVDGKLVAGAAQ